MSVLPPVAGLAELRAATAGDPRLTVALLDGRVDLAHPSFAGADLREIVPAGGLAGSSPSAHGTHVAGIVFARGNAVMAGIAPACRGLALPIFGHESDGRWACHPEELAAAIHTALDQGAQILNISAGRLIAGRLITGRRITGTGLAGAAGAELDAAIGRCRSVGALVIAAAGNDSCNCEHVPAALPGVLAVGAMDRRGQPLPFSNFGSAYLEQGLLVLGEEIAGPVPPAGFRQGSGTSYAAAVLTGIVALLASRQLEAGLAVDLPEIRRALLASAAGCAALRLSEPRRCLVGRLDLRRATEDLFGVAVVSREAAAAPAPVHPLAFAAADPPLPAFPFTAQEATMFDNDSRLPDFPVSTVSASATTSATTSTTADPSLVEPSEIKASCACSCGGGGGAQLVYVVGNLNVDFQSRARRQSFAAAMGQDPGNLAALLAYLENSPWAAGDLLFTLEIDSVPLYALAPSGPFAEATFTALRQLLAKQAAGGLVRISVAGVLGGKTSLESRQEVAVLRPNLRGLVEWNPAALLGKERSEEIGALLDRFLYELRNTGVSPADRAVNAAGSMIFGMRDLLSKIVADNKAFDRLEVSRSKMAPPDSDSWDVSLVFFDPKHLLDRARQIVCLTVDVSQPLPIRIGELRTWAAYSA